LVIFSKELQLELQQLLPSDTAIYQPLYEMTQVIGINIGFEMLDYISLSSVNVYFDDYCICLGPH
jgi:hypothetical protein